MRVRHIRLHRSEPLLILRCLTAYMRESRAGRLKLLDRAVTVASTYADGGKTRPRCSYHSISAAYSPTEAGDDDVDILIPIWSCMGLAVCELPLANSPNKG
jgi:hypothetical protein